MVLVLVLCSLSCHGFGLLSNMLIVFDGLGVTKDKDCPMANQLESII